MKERYHQLTGHYIDDELLHLGVVNGCETTYACGAKPLGLVSTFLTDSGGNVTLDSIKSFRVKPTQHRAWTKDSDAFDRAPNRCHECQKTIEAATEEGPLTKAQREQTEDLCGVSRGFFK